MNVPRTHLAGKRMLQIITWGADVTRGSSWVCHAHFGPLGNLAVCLPPIGTVCNHHLIRETFLNNSWCLPDEVSHSGSSGWRTQWAPRRAAGEWYIKGGVWEGLTRAVAGLEQWVRNMALPMVAHLPRPARGKSALYEEGREGEVSGVHFTTVEQTEGQGRRQLIPEKSQQEDLNFKLLKLKEFLHPKIRERKGKGFLKQCFTANHVLLLVAATNALILYLGKNFPHSWAGVVLRVFISLQLVCGQHHCSYCP